METELCTAPRTDYMQDFDIVTVYLKDCDTTSLMISNRMNILLEKKRMSKESVLVGFQILGVRDFVSKFLGNKELNPKISEILKEMEQVYSHLIFGDYKSAIIGAVEHLPLRVNFSK